MSPSDIQLDLTPLLDVVFIVLIFFIVSTSFMNFDSVPMHLKSEKTVKGDSKNTALITINPDNTIGLSGREVALRALPALLRAEQSTAALMVLVRSDGQANTETLVSVVDAIQQASAHYTLEITPVQITRF